MQAKFALLIFGNIMKVGPIDQCAILSKQEEQILKSHRSSLDIQKYMKGKQSFKKFVAEFNGSQGTHQYTEQYVKTNYLNKILFISSIKYYRDIRMLLMDQLSQPHIREQAARELNQVIRELQNIAEGKKINRLPSSEPAQPPKETQIAFSTAQKPLQSCEHAYSNSQGRSKLKLMNISFRLRNKELLQQKLQQQKIREAGKEKDNNDILKMQKQEEQNGTDFLKIDPSEYKFLKLFSVQSSQNSKKNTLTVSTDRTFNHPAAAPLLSDRSPRLITNLQDNKLYHKHHSPNARVNKSVQPRQAARSQRRQKKSERICNKILSCLRALLLRFQERKAKKEEEEEDYLLQVNRSGEASKKVAKAQSSIHP